MVSRVDVAGDLINWSLGLSGWEGGAPAVDALDAFLGLVRLDDGKFLSFISRYGPLGIGTDGRPLAMDGSLPPVMEITGEPRHIESAAMWRAYSQHARDVIALAGALRKGKRVDADHVLEPDDLRRPTLAGFRWLGRAALVDNLQHEIVLRPHHPTEHYRRRPRLYCDQHQREAELTRKRKDAARRRCGS